MKKVLDCGCRYDEGPQITLCPTHVAWWSFGSSDSFVWSVFEQAFTSAAKQLQRDCPACSAGIPIPAVPCLTCHGTTKMGITALELAEALKDGGIALLVKVATYATDGTLFWDAEPNIPEVPRDLNRAESLLAKLQPKEAR